MYRQGSSGWTSMRNEEFQEEEIWGNFINERHESGSNLSRSKIESSSNFSPRRLPSAAKMVPRSNKSSIQEPKITQHSAPVNIPDWSKIYGTSWKKTSWCDGGNDGDSNGKGYNFVNDDDDEDGDDDEGAMMPPHEWIAKKLERSKISSFSVCEGVGRTLKGRDLSRVRNAILSKTGFLE
ncbi:hypothetical protein HAX54_016953 [Datura stramonium]|uniref:Senescence regulator n=1 Tax=Datura stramonium TaxID=4076 RepID=A0ABS8Y4Z2_DATST|nr:hypothetical protein [Datura stramonium]